MGLIKIMKFAIKKSLNKTKSVKSINSPVSYFPTNYGFNIPNVNPNNIKIAILDTGFPSHIDMSNIGLKSDLNCIDLLAYSSDAIDKNGHATLVSGVLASSNPGSLIGMAPSATYYFCKIIDDDGMGDTSNITAGIIWALSHNVDIILLCAGSPIHDRYLEKMVKKAFEMGCIFIASSGREVTGGSRTLYPAAFDGVVCCSSSRKNSCLFDKARCRLDVSVDASSLWSTYSSDSYIKASGSSMAASVVCGCAINLIGDCMIKKIKLNGVKGFMTQMLERFKVKNV